MTERMLTCAETFERLDDYVDRELRADEISAVEAHLTLCARCSEEFAVERELLDRVRATLGRIQVPADLRAKIAQRLRQP